MRTLCKVLTVLPERAIKESGETGIGAGIVLLQKDGLIRLFLALGLLLALGSLFSLGAPKLNVGALFSSRGSCA